MHHSKPTLLSLEMDSIFNNKLTGAESCYNWIGENESN